jgi:hypothetical protein
VKNTSVLDPLCPARTKILRGNRSREAGRNLEWHESVATCELTSHRFILTLFQTVTDDRTNGVDGWHPYGEDNPPREIK